MPVTPLVARSPGLRVAAGQPDRRTLNQRWKVRMLDDWGTTDARTCAEQRRRPPAPQAATRQLRTFLAGGRAAAAGPLAGRPPGKVLALVARMTPSAGTVALGELPVAQRGAEGDRAG